MQNYHNSSAVRKAIQALIMVVLSLSIGFGAQPPDVRDHRVEFKVDKEVIIVPQESGLKRAMLGMVRHPDGTIFVNTQFLGLVKSTDEGLTWTPVQVDLPGAPAKQKLQGLGVSRDARLWLLHQTFGKEGGFPDGKDLFVSNSSDGGRTWITTAIDYGNLAPGAPEDPYATSGNDYNTFIEGPDGTMMVAVGARYADWKNYQQADQWRPGIRDVMIRSNDGGKSWGDPAILHQHCNETSLAVDPNNPEHLLAMTRIQRMLLPGEDRATVEKMTRCAPGTEWPYKNGILLESTDGGRSFRELPGGMTRFYAMRGTILWASNNIVVITHQGGRFENWSWDKRLVARISVDGGKKWVDGTKEGTPLMNQSKKFELLGSPSNHSFTAPTVEISPNHFLTAVCVHPPKSTLAVKGLFWHIEKSRADDSASLPESSLLHIGHDKQLFIDDYVIESLEGVSKSLNQPTKHPGNPLIPMVPIGARSWDAGLMLSGFASVIYDEDEQLFKTWYGAIQIEPAGKTPEGRGKFSAPGDAAAVLAYATSKDGLTWDKPSLDLVNFHGSTDNNLVLNFDMCGTGVFKDSRETDPAKRYKMLWIKSSGNCEVYAAYSANGLHWTNYSDDKPAIFHPPGHDTHAAPYWDEQLGKYVAIIRDRTGRIKEVRKPFLTDEAARETWRKHWGRDRSPENHSLRRVGQCESDDFVNWTPMRVIVGADEHDPVTVDQFYNLEAFVYEKLRIGLMTVYSYDPEYCRGDVQLTYSRDGLNWHRGGNREVFLPVSPQPGDFDWGTVYPLQGPLRVVDEIWIYYMGRGADHNHVLPDGITQMQAGLGLAKVRLDGFVSLDAAADEGTITTRSFSFEGSHLLINSDADSGQVLVEILDDQGVPVEGYRRQDCDAFRGDNVRHMLTWRGGADLKNLEGKVVKLRFYLKGAKLFSFRFRD